MGKKLAKALVIGLGNELRGDDALGRIAARKLRDAVRTSEIQVIDQTAPTPELAAPIAESELVVFLDASVDGPIDEVVTQRLREPDSTQPMTHRCDPQALVVLARSLYGHAPPAFSVTFRGRSFDFGDCQLSPQAAAASESIVQATLAIIEAHKTSQPSEVICEKDIQRLRIIVQGRVQGVGFRPFVHRLARQHQLCGHVRNQGSAVIIEVEGAPLSVNQFQVEVRDTAPRLARVDSITTELVPAQGSQEFTIESSRFESRGEITIAPDVATCAACCKELFDPASRRYRHPFVNCTDCGPRLTIVRGSPYDRGQTTMAKFVMCEACRAEYEAPHDRRFHAEPIACPDCGPQLAAFDMDGRQLETGDPLKIFERAISRGGIGALKGLGGYHLVCDARNDSAVRELRRRKHRDEKPFAVMVSDVDAARGLCHVSVEEAELLSSSARPIVLLRRKDDELGRWQSCSPTCPVAPSVAPGSPYLGVMLPYTPLHHLLLHDIGDSPLVMTSGNRSDEPIAFLDDDVFDRLRGIADVFLTHDRPINLGCDDSVVRVSAARNMPLRRSRGYAPNSVLLPTACSRPTLAVGGQLKNTFAIAQDRRAVLSHHLGDLSHLAAHEALLRAVELYEQLFDIRPELIVHDLHPDYLATQYAQRRAAEEDLALLAVQHHHAHLASCMAEHGLSEPVIGVTLDGTGYGTDGAVWGGEFLVGDYAHFSRAAHLRYVQMPGGERAIREPWRMALSHLMDAECQEAEMQLEVSAERLRTARQMVERGFNSPQTSSMGRLFDAVAALITKRAQVSFEGQAAMELESLASGSCDEAAYDFNLCSSGAREGVRRNAMQAGTGSHHVDSVVGAPPLNIDVRPVIAAIVDELRSATEASVVARRFHNTVVEMIRVTTERIGQTHGISAVVLTGGVFQNALLVDGARQQLLNSGFDVYLHHVVPANDGGLSLGQLAVAAATEQESGAATSAIHATGV